MFNSLSIKFLESYDIQNVAWWKVDSLIFLHRRLLVNNGLQENLSSAILPLITQTGYINIFIYLHVSVYVHTRVTACLWKTQGKW